MPILLSRDLNETLAFSERLGFENRGAPPEEWRYLIVGRGEVQLHFIKDLGVDPLTTSSMCYLYVDGAQQLFDEWRSIVEPDPSTGSRIVTPTDTDYGMRGFAVVDRNGNLVRVGSAPCTRGDHRRNGRREPPATAEITRGWQPSRRSPCSDERRRPRRLLHRWRVRRG